MHCNCGPKVKCWCVLTDCDLLSILTLFQYASLIFHAAHTETLVPDKVSSSIAVKQQSDEEKH